MVPKDLAHELTQPPTLEVACLSRIDSNAGCFLRRISLVILKSLLREEFDGSPPENI